MASFYIYANDIYKLWLFSLTEYVRLHKMLLREEKYCLQKFYFMG